MKTDKQSRVNASSHPISIPRLTPDQRQGLQDYWRVYEAHREEITAQVLEMAQQHPEFRYILQNSLPPPSPAERARIWEIQRRAVLHNEWEPYLLSLQEQGMGYA